MKFKNILLSILFSIICWSCCYHGEYSKGGFPRQKVREYREKNTIINLVDTLAAYNLKVTYGVNSITKEYTFYEKEINHLYPYTPYLKFYPDNKVSLFIIPKSDTLKLTREHFDPRNSKMGYYYIDGKKIKLKISTISQCSLDISQSIGEIKGDSIVFSDKSGGRIYVKQNIPKEYFINWKPDW